MIVLNEIGNSKGVISVISGNMVLIEVVIPVVEWDERSCENNPGCLLKILYHPTPQS